MAPASEMTGYSWQVLLLPYLAQQKLYDEIVVRSQDFALSPFNPQLTSSGDGLSLQPFASFPLKEFTCSALVGDKHSAAPEYSIHPNAVARGSYVAFAATHLDQFISDGSGRPARSNGLLGQGLGPATVADGISKTFMLTETREPNYTSWYDGSVCWVVGANPTGPQPTYFHPSGEPPIWTVPSGTAINLGPTGRNKQPYLPAKLHGSIQQDWQWGPSSLHLGGIVVHAVGDGSARAINEDIDAVVYLSLISAQGREAARIPD